jgi:hypothetical protein
VYEHILDVISVRNEDRLDADVISWIVGAIYTC